MDETWKCPVCDAVIEVPSHPNFQGPYFDMSKVEAHKRDHQRYGMMLS